MLSDLNRSGCWGFGSKSTQRCVRSSPLALIMRALAGASPAYKQKPVCDSLTVVLDLFVLQTAHPYHCVYAPPLHATRRTPHGASPLECKHPSAFFETPTCSVPAFEGFEGPCMTRSTTPPTAASPEARGASLDARCGRCRAWGRGGETGGRETSESDCV